MARAIEQVQPLADISRSALHAFAGYKAIGLHTCSSSLLQLCGHATELLLDKT